ncbi:MAG: hypothetical protein Q7R49_06075 [Candidatus Daviesbacteria bacterium]|nr:hypothetical protein [Candidatus Daviesbacteria bacterium]
MDPLIGSEPVLGRGTSLIRGEQMAQFLGAKYNPTSGYENDLRIYLKPRSLDHIKDGDYVDVSDSGDVIIEQLKKRPKLKLIASSKATYQYLKERLPNKIVFIPEHHCNFERAKRTRDEIITGGYIGAPNPFIFGVNPEIEKRLAKIGLKFLAFYYFKSRQDVVDFYKKIDFQIIPHFWFDDSEIYRHPTKMISAASFGIPTVAARKSGYKEWEGNYISVQSMEDMLIEVEKLKNQDYYEMWSDKGTRAAESYHIENVAKLYRQLT